MRDLGKALQALSKEVLNDDFESMSDLESVTLLIENELGSKPLQAYDRSHLGDLPKDQQGLYWALLSAEMTAGLYQTIAFDGVLAVFYNEDGSTIAQMLETLRRVDARLAAAFEQVRQIAAPILDIQPDQNWVVRHRGQQPMEQFSKAQLAAIEKQESTMTDLQESVFEQVLEQCKAAFRRIAEVA